LKNALKKKELNEKKPEAPVKVDAQQIIDDVDAKKPVIENLEEKREAALKLQSSMQKYRSEG